MKNIDIPNLGDKISAGWASEVARAANELNITGTTNIRVGSDPGGLSFTDQPSQKFANTKPWTCYAKNNSGVDIEIGDCVSLAFDKEDDAIYSTPKMSAERNSRPYYAIAMADIKSGDTGLFRTSGWCWAKVYFKDNVPTDEDFGAEEYYVSPRDGETHLEYSKTSGIFLAAAIKPWYEEHLVGSGGAEPSTEGGADQKFARCFINLQKVGTPKESDILIGTTTEADYSSNSVGVPVALFDPLTGQDIGDGVVYFPEIAFFEKFAPGTRILCHKTWVRVTGSSTD